SRRELHDAVEGAADEIGELHFDHRSQAHQRHPGGHAGESELRDRRVDHASRAELGFEPPGDLEGAAEVAGDVFPQQEDARIAAHLLAQRLADRRDVGELAPAGRFVGAGETEGGLNQRAGLYTAREEGIGEVLSRRAAQRSWRAPDWVCAFNFSTTAFKRSRSAFAASTRLAASRSAASRCSVAFFSAASSRCSAACSRAMALLSAASSRSMAFLSAAASRFIARSSAASCRAASLAPATRFFW